MQDKKLSPVLKQMIMDSKQIKQDLVSLEGQVSAYQNSLDGLVVREKALSAITTVEQDFIALRKNKVRYGRIKVERDNVEQVDTQLSTVNQYISAVEGSVLTPILCLGNVASGVNQFSQLAAIRDVYSNLQAEISMLDFTINKDRPAVDTFAQINPVHVKRYYDLSVIDEALVSTNYTLKQLEIAVVSLDAVPSQAFPEQSVISRYEKLNSHGSNLFSFIKDIENTDRVISAYETTLASVSVIDPSAIVRLRDLRSLELQVSSFDSQIKMIDVSAIEIELTSAITALEAYKSEVRLCPMCNTEFSSHEGGVHGKSNS